MFNEYIIEGIKIIGEAINENAPIKHIVICDDGEEFSSMPHDFMFSISKYDCIYVPKKIFDSITDVSNPQGLLAVVQKPDISTLSIDYSEDIIVALDNIQDPR